MEQNFDESILINQRINLSFDEPLVHQVLRIAIYDEFHAYELYSGIIKKFGSQSPFSEIVEAENQHYNLLLPLLEKYSVNIPINDWYQRIEIPDTLMECCEVGVAAEIDNIAMYEHLLKYTQDIDIKDTLYRLQAASYNNHLPAFRQCLSQHYIELNQYSGHIPEEPASECSETQTNDEQAYANHGQHNPDEIFAKAEEYQSLIQSLMSGNIDQQELSKLLQNSNMALIGGLLAGGLGTMILTNLKKDSEPSEQNEQAEPTESSAKTN